MGYVILGFFLIVLYGLSVIVRDMNRFVVTPYTVRSDKINRQYTIVMLSDLHNKTYGRENEKLVRAIEDCHPDCIMTAGDMYTSVKGSRFDNALALLSALSKRFPVYIANGNHEHKTAEHPDYFDHMYETYTEKLRGMGLEPLINTHVILPEVNIDVCGLQIGREYFKHFKKKEMPGDYMDKLAGKANARRFQILLAHNPLYFKEYAVWGADLVLSGHMHGGIIRLPFLGGVVSPAVTPFPKYDGGRFAEGKSTMILGRGLGTHSLPVRMWNPGELVVVTLLPAEKD